MKAPWGHRCPLDPAHGLLMARKDGQGWYCPHVAHDGRLRGHPLGFAPQTRATFTTVEAETGVVAGWTPGELAEAWGK